jgi:hypothetical protein
MKTLLFAAAMLAAIPASAQTYGSHYNYVGGGYSCNDVNGNGWGVTPNTFGGGWTVQSQHNGQPYNSPYQPYQSYIPTLRPLPPPNVPITGY